MLAVGSGDYRSLEGCWESLEFSVGARETLPTSCCCKEKANYGKVILWTLQKSSLVCLVTYLDAIVGASFLK